VPKTEPNCLIRFGVFEVDPRTGELRSKGSRVKLQDQPLQILLALLEKPGEVVTREELRAKLWPADTFVDFDHGLNAAVKRLRDALADTAETPRYIETLPRRGYRLIAATVSDAIQPEESRSPLRRWRFPLAAAAVLLIAAVLFGLDAGGVRGKLFSRSAVQPQIRSLAVLPLINLSGDPEQEYFADGMTEELITELSRIGSLRVISRTSVMRYKGEKKKPLAQIGRELNVDAVMEGSVLRAGNRVRIAAHMIYAPTDENVMAETYERDLGDVLKLQSVVAQAIAQQVRIQLTPEQQARLHSAPVVNPRAYEAYLKGRFHVDETQAEIKQAQSYFEEAVREDPSFALAYVGLAECYLGLGTYRWMPPQDAYRHGSEAVHKALQLDESLGEAHGTLGYLNWRYDWDWQAAERDSALH
jgi:TolB-like protein/DNA-binding winged helix-turn-helix (wHTH) protein